MGNWILNTQSIIITKDILNKIAEVDEFKGTWKAIGRLAPERLLKLRKVATIESIGSSTRIEGAKLTNQEVEALLANIDLKSFTSRDEQEVGGYAAVMELVFSSWQEIRITENHIQQLHRDLLKYSTKDERHRGAYKTLANNVEAFDPDGNSLGVVFTTTSPFETPQRMADLIAWFSGDDEDTLHPLLRTAIFLVTFLAIHPFQDGNGRLSRVLTNLLLLRAGYVYVPFSSLESIVEESKEAYYLALRRTQQGIWSKSPDWTPWIDFFLHSLVVQKRRLQNKIEREEILMGSLPKLSVGILEIVKEHGRITIAEAVRATGASRNTIKDHVKGLVQKGYLVKHGAGRGAWYSLSETSFTEMP